MERWVIKTEKIIYKLLFFLQTHFSSTPVFHHSNCDRSELSSERKQSVEERLGIYTMNPLAWMKAKMTGGFSQINCDEKSD